jgi:DNA-binding beta-propeller fold protein YncE
VIDTDTDRLVATLPLAYNAQLTIAGPRGYSLDLYTGAVDVLDTSAQRIVGRFSLGHGARRLQASADGVTLYVAYDDRVGVLDAASGQERASIAVNGGILHFAAAPDGRVAWAAHDDTLTKIDLVAGRATAYLRAGAEVRAIEFTPDSGAVLVGTDSGLLLVDNSDATIRAAVSTARMVRPIAVSADGQRAYAGLAASSYRGPALAVIDAASGTMLRTVPLDTPPAHVIAAPGGGAYAVTESGLWLVADAGGAATPVAVDTNPVALAATPDGARLYVSLWRAVDVIDAGRATRETTIPLPYPYRGLAVSGDGRRAYVSTREGIATIDTQISSVVETLPQPAPFDGFDALALAPDEELLYGLGYTRDGMALASLEADGGALRALLPGGMPYGGLAIASDGMRLFDLGSFACTGGVARIDTTAPAIDSALSLDGEVRRLALSPDSRRLWIATSEGLSVVDPERFVVIERRPLADGALDVALGCRPADCPLPPTAVPRTPPALVPTATPTPLPPTPTDTPTRPPAEPPDVVIAVGSATGAPGDRIELALSLRQEFGAFIAGVQVDLDFDPVVAPAPWLEQRPDCAIDPGLEPREAAFELLPPGCTLGESCPRMRARIGSWDWRDWERIFDDEVTLFRCRFDVAADAASGLHAVRIAAAEVLTFNAARPPRIIDGGVTVVVPAGHTPVPTRTPAAAPTPGGCDPAAVRSALLCAGVASGRAGARVTIPVSLRTNQYEIAGVQVDVGFGPHASVAAATTGLPDCRVDPVIDKAGTRFSFQPPFCTPGVDCAAIRAIVLALDNVDPIADAARLFECEFEIAADAPAGWMELPLEHLGGSDGTGNRVSTVGAAGGIFVSAAGAPPTATPTPTPASAQRPIQGSIRDASGCQVGGSQHACVWFMLLPAALLFGGRRRSRRSEAS